MYIIPGKYGVHMGKYGIKKGRSTVIRGEGCHNAKNTTANLEGSGFKEVPSYRFDNKGPRFLQKARNNIRFQS